MEFLAPLDVAMNEEKREKAKRTWQYKVVEATRGNQTMLGAVVIAMLNKQSAHPPRFWRNGATIDADGYVHSELQDRTGIWKRICIGHATDLAKELNILADQCKLHDHERLALFSEAQKWISRDARATSNLQ